MAYATDPSKAAALVWFLFCVALWFVLKGVWASSWDYGTYHIGDQRRLRWTCASAQSRQSLRLSHTWSMEVDEGSDQNSDIYSHWTAAHARLKNEFTEDEKCHNLMSWLVSYWVFPCSLFSYFTVLLSIVIPSLWEERIGLYEPRHEKTCLRGFRPGKTLTGLPSHRS